MFEQYQKARAQFVQMVAELANRPQNIEILQNAGELTPDPVGAVLLPPQPAPHTLGDPAPSGLPYTLWGYPQPLLAQRVWPPFPVPQLPTSFQLLAELLREQRDRVARNVSLSFLRPQPTKACRSAPSPERILGMKFPDW